MSAAEGGRVDMSKVPPRHPGEALKVFFVVNRGLTLDEVGHKAQIDIAKLNEIVDGKVAIDIGTASMLKKSFGDVADLLYRMQYVFDVFQERRVRPSYNDIVTRIAPL